VKNILFFFLFYLSPMCVFALDRTEIIFPKDKITVQTQMGAAEFNVELAITPQQQAHGLMWRYEMPMDAGMLFIFSGEKIIQMWMKNTPLPLDMVFFDKTGTVTHVIERTKPYREDVLSSEKPAMGVLEVNAGTVPLYNIRPGDKIIFNTGSLLEKNND
jgi:uncharacterized membrane protein (UPF0127 family)